MFMTHPSPSSPPSPPPKAVGFSNQKGSMFQVKNLFHKSSLSWFLETHDVFNRVPDRVDSKSQFL